MFAPPRIAVVVGGLLAAARVAAAPLTPAAFPLERHQLPNGLTVWTHEDHTVPSVTLWQWYRVGSRHERAGRTGLSHFLEHMMFNGSAHLGPREFDTLLESHGGSSNAFTDREFTSYYEDVPAPQLDVILALDADRMAGLALLPDQIAREREVIKEERRTRTENDIDGQLDEALWRTAFPTTPAGWPVLGSMADIDALTRDDLAAYFARHYAPNSCVLVLTGDFDTADAMVRIARHFGAIPAVTRDADSIAVEPPQEHERRVRVTYGGDAASLLLGYRVPGARHPDVPVLQIVSMILGGSSSARLSEALVRQRGVALDTDASYEVHLDETLFEISVGLAPGVRVSRGLAAIDSTIARLAAEGPTPREVKTAAAQLALGLLRSLSTNNGAGEQIGYADLLHGDARHLYDAIPRWDAVSAEDVRRIVRTYLVPAHRTVAELVPEAPR